MCQKLYKWPTVCAHALCACAVNVGVYFGRSACKKRWYLCETSALYSLYFKLHKKRDYIISSSFCLLSPSHSDTFLFSSLSCLLNWFFYPNNVRETQYDVCLFCWHFSLQANNTLECSEVLKIWGPVGEAAGLSHATMAKWCNISLQPVIEAYIDEEAVYANLSMSVSRSKANEKKHISEKEIIFKT